MQAIPTLLCLAFLHAVPGLCDTGDWETRFRRGLDFQNSGNLAGAVREFELSLRQAEQLAPDDKRLPVTLNNLGVAYMDLCRLAEAERCFRRALALYEKWHPDLNIHIARTVRNLGELSFSQNRMGAAEKYYRRAFELSLKTSPVDPELVEYSMLGLARTFHLRRKFDAAEILYRQVLAGMEELDGRDAPVLTVVLNDLAVLYMDMDRNGEAQTNLERCIRLSPDAARYRPQFVMALMNLAKLHWMKSEIEVAEALFQEAIANAEKWLGFDHHQTGVAVGAYGEFLQHTRRKQEAKPILARSRRILEQSFRESGRQNTIDISEFGAR